MPLPAPGGGGSSCTPGVDSSCCRSGCCRPPGSRGSCSCSTEACPAPWALPAPPVATAAAGGDAAGADGGVPGLPLTFFKPRARLLTGVAGAAGSTASSEATAAAGVAVVVGAGVVVVAVGAAAAGVAGRFRRVAAAVGVAGAGGSRPMRLIFCLTSPSVRPRTPAITWRKERKESLGAKCEPTRTTPARSEQPGRCGCKDG